MAPQGQQPHKTAVVALFLLASLVAAPAVAAYRPEAGGYSPATPAESATPSEPAASTPAEAATSAKSAAGYTDSTPSESAASTPAEAATPAKPAAGYTDSTPSEPAASTPAEAATPAKPAAGYTDSTPSEPAASTPAEAATPTEAAASTPAKAGTPTEAAASTPAEAGTPTEAAASTPAEAGKPAAGYTDSTPAEPAADGTTTPAGEGKATTVEQKFIEKVNAAYKKALDAANAAAPDDKFSVFDAVFNKEIKECLSGMTNSAKFIAMVDRAFKIAYNSAVAATTTAQNKFSVLVLTLTEALRFIAATVDAHAVKPAIEEVVAGGIKAATGAQQVIKKLDSAIKTAAAAAKEAPKADRVLVFQAAFNKAIRDQMGPAYDEKKTIPELNAAYKEAIAATTASKPETKDADIEEAFAKSITSMAEATKAGAEAATEPAAEAATGPAAAEAGYKPADKSATEPAADAATAPSAEAATEPAADAATAPAAAEAGYKPAAEATTESAAEPAAEAAAKPAAEAAPEPAAEAASKPADAEAGYKPAADAATKPAAAGGYNL